MEKYKYDVAFSFLSDDETVALNLTDLLKDRLRCFIYSEQQKRLAGTDGEQEFNQVFSEDTHIVVVLYRENWGKTAWTRIEETAIRNRAHEEGYGFVIFIPMDGSTPPRWLPKSQLWVGLKRWGIEAAAAVIEARASEHGAEIRELSIADKFANVEKEQNEKRNREHFIGTLDGLNQAINEVENLKKLCKKYIEDIKSKAPSWWIEYREDQVRFHIISYGYKLYFHSRQSYSNSGSNFMLTVSLYDGQHLEKDSMLIFDINYLNENGWNTENKNAFKTTTKLTDDWFTIFLQKITKRRTDNNY